MASQSNAVSHWLGANLESALYYHWILCRYNWWGSLTNLDDWQTIFIFYYIFSNSFMENYLSTSTLMSSNKYIYRWLNALELRLFCIKPSMLLFHESHFQSTSDVIWHHMNSRSSQVHILCHVQTWTCQADNIWKGIFIIWMFLFCFELHNKANLRDLIAAAGPVTLFGQRDLEIAWMIVKNNHLQTLNSDPYLRFLGLCNLEIWQMKIQEELHSREQ